MIGRHAGLAAGALAAGLLVSMRAAADDAPAEREAHAAIRKAARDFRAADLASAEFLLARAALGCGADKCSARTKAAVLRDLRSVQLRAADAAGAAESFGKAFALEPDIQLNPIYDASDVRAAWEAVASAAHSGQQPNDNAHAHEAPREPSSSPRSSTDAASRESAPEEASTDAEAAQDERPPSLRDRVDRTAYATWWFGIAGSVEFVSLPAASDVCTLTSSAAPANAAGYYCTNPDGSDFPSRITASQNASLVAGQAGAVAGGIHPGDVRAMLTADYAVSPSLMVGGRLGLAGNTYPGSAAVSDRRAFSSKLYLEARVTYLLGEAPLATLGFSPMVFVATGVGEFDGHVTTVVSQENVAGQEPVSAWLTSGPWFLAAGGGFRYQFSLRAAFSAAARANVAFGGATLATYGPEIGFQYGF